MVDAMLQEIARLALEATPLTLPASSQPEPEPELQRRPTFNADEMFLSDDEPELEPEPEPQPDGVDYV